MRKIKTQKIKDTVKKLCIKANTELRKDALKALKKGLKKETKKTARLILSTLIQNQEIAKEKKLAICQDTGIAVIDVKIGQQVSVIGGDLKKAILEGVRGGYKEGYFRRSVVLHPLKRKTPFGYNYATINFDIEKGNKIKITVLPKGFGSENKSKIKMFNPTATLEKIEEFLVDTVKKAGPGACPPYVIGIGIGGTFDRAALLSKKALFHDINKKNSDKFLNNIEKRFFKKINKMNIGPGGLGGKTTCLGLNILTESTHIAGLPVAINICCHALRSSLATI